MTSGAAGNPHTERPPEQPSADAETIRILQDRLAALENQITAGIPPLPGQYS